MLSIVICSADKAKLEALKKNVAATIGGHDYEILAIDNTVEGKPITEVYNLGAARARYPYLLFVHEDVEFRTRGWFDRILPRLSQEDCGVIGFAGSRGKVAEPSGWIQNKKWRVADYREIAHGKERHARFNVAAGEEGFRWVAVLDGFALFVRRDVWEATPFDDKLLRGFHGYDIDFTLSVGRTRKNYVCCGIDIIHYSRGSFGEAWLRATLDVNEKWRGSLPVTVGDEPAISRKEIERASEHAAFRMVRKVKRAGGIPLEPYVRRFRSYPLSFRHLINLIRLRLL